VRKGETMRVGIMQNSLVGGDVKRSFKLAAQAGADGLEIACDDPEAIESILSSRGVAEIARLKKTHKLEVPSIGLGLLREGESLFGDDAVVEEAKNVIQQAVGAAREIGAGVVLVPFLGKAVIEVEKELDRVVGNLEELAEAAEAASVTLGIESTLNVDQQKYLLSHLGAYESVKVYYDTGNALSRKFDPAIFLRDLGPDNVCQMHFKDVRLGEEGTPPDFDVALGEGDVDFPAIANAIQAMHYPGWVIVETPATDDPLAAAKANLTFARQVLG
jgi:L-ribulose-5-phosphate 3-epimerase